MKKKNFILSMMLCILFSISNCISALSDKIDVSVIVPIYNVEKYLDECLDSIENQTKTDSVEIICVNDGSSDKSPEILKRHADKNDKIKVINQENQGLSEARNSGMKIAKGKYIMFVDSDDLIVPYAIEKAYSTAEKYNADVVKISSVAFRDSKNLNLGKYKYDDSKTCCSKRNMNQNPFEVWKKYDIPVMAWSKFWKRDFIERNNLSFKKGIKLEDVLFTWLSLPRLSEIAIDDNIFYLYRKNRPGSIMYNLYRNLVDRIENNITIAEELVRNRDFVKFDDSDNWIIQCIFSLCYNSISRNLKIPEKQKYYSSKYLDILDSFIKKYNVKVSRENQSKMNVYRRLANMKL